MASNNANWSKNEVITSILHGEGVPVAPWAGYLLTIAIFGVALAARFIILSVEGGAPFVTFYPAVILSAFLFGARPGLLTVALSTVAAEYIFLPPYWSFSLDASQISPLAAFILSGSTICFLIYQMQHSSVELRKYKDIVESSTDAIVGKTPGGIITSWNKGAEKMFGYTADEIIGKSITILALPASHPKIHELFEKICRGITVANQDSERIRKDGALIHVAINLSPIRDATGNITGISTIARDITEKKRMEKELRLNEEGALALLALDSNADKLDEKALLQEGVEEAERLTLSQIAYLHFVNEDQQTIELSNWSQRTQKHCKVVLDNHYPIANAGVWADCVRNKQPVMHNDYQNLSNKPEYLQNDTHAIRILIVPVLEGGLVRLIMGVGNKTNDYDQADSRLLQMIANNLWRVVRRRRTEKTLKNKSAQLEAANRELESFAYAVTHNLKAPLRAMSGFSHALVEDYGDKFEGDAKNYLDQIDIASRNMGELIDGILTLLRSTRGEMKHDSIDLSKLAVQLLEKLEHNEPERKVEWHVEQNLRATGDTSMIEAVLRNLLSNAWKYTEKTNTAVIRVFLSEIDGRQGFCVADNGAGFDKAHSERLFKPFQRLHRQDEFSGLGIGLATVQRIVNRHGGEVCAKGQPGNGATFCFTLPTMSSEKTS